MFGEDLDNSATLASGSNIPLEVATAIVQNGIEFVGDELVGGKDSECSGIS